MKDEETLRELANSLSKAISALAEKKELEDRIDQLEDALNINIRKAGEINEETRLCRLKLHAFETKFGKFDEHFNICPDCNGHGDYAELGPCITCNQLGYLDKEGHNIELL